MSLGNSILELAQTKNTLQLFLDESCEMAKIEFNGTPIYSGNYWDFHPGCFGDHDFAEITGWNGTRPLHLMKAIQVFCELKGLTLEALTCGTYKY